MVKYSYSSLVLISVFLTGCAGMARSVTPVPIPVADYEALDCTQKQEMLVEKRGEEEKLSRKQNYTALADATGVLVTLVPVGSVLGANLTGELAEVKGEVGALERSIEIYCAENESAMAQLAEPADNKKKRRFPKFW